MLDLILIGPAGRVGLGFVRGFGWEYFGPRATRQVRGRGSTKRTTDIQGMDP